MLCNVRLDLPSQEALLELSLDAHTSKLSVEKALVGCSKVVQLV